MVGSALLRLYPDAESPTTKQFHSESYDVRGRCIVHLAAKVGGVKANTDEIGEFFRMNSIINQKLLHMA